jgi:uncharacterized protein (TIGR03382 family)
VNGVNWFVLGSIGGLPVAGILALLVVVIILRRRR